MEAKLQMHSVKVLTKALACLSRYSDDLDILALPSSLTLSSTNSSKSAYCRLTLDAAFFESYTVHIPGSQPFVGLETQGADDSRSVKAQILVKALLSILRHKNVESSVERVQLSIRDPSPTQAVATPRTQYDSDDEAPSAESRMVVRLLCKHGVVKTHRLLLLQLDELMAPSIPRDPDNPQSTVTAGPRVLRDILDHIKPGSAKADRQLEWEFGGADMNIRTVEGKGDLSTEVSMSAHDLTTYDVPSPPISLSFHLREFAATIALAESLSLPLTLTFTDAPSPLVVDLESGGGGEWEVQAYIATGGAAGLLEGTRVKRTRTTDSRHTSKIAKLGNHGPSSRNKDVPVRPEPEVELERRVSQDDDPMQYLDAPERAPSPHGFRAEFSQRARSQQPAATQAGPGPSQFHAPSQFAERAPTFRLPSQMPSATPSFAPAITSTRLPASTSTATRVGSERKDVREPLFLPASQLSPDSLRATGLGLEDMNEEELNMLLDGDFDMDDDVDFTRHSPPRENEVPAVDDDEAFEQPEDDFEFPPTQRPMNGGKKFKPLFPD